MTRKHTEYRRTCEICGKVFYSSRVDARFDTNACKMVNYRRVKAQRLIEQKMTLDMDTYSLFQQVVDRTPPLAHWLAEYLKKHDKDDFKNVLYMLTIAQTQSDMQQYADGVLSEQRA
jgi:hypothetical protein